MTTKVRIERPIRASRERLWRACTEPKELARWQADSASGRMAPGERVSLSWPKLGLTTHIDVISLEPEQSLALRHGTSSVLFDLGPGSLTLTHSGVPEGDIADGVASSWRVSLALLSHYLEHHPDSDRAVQWFVARANVPPATAHVYFTDPSALASWLTREGGVADEGQPYRLQLLSGEPMSGKVLANTPGRDVALAWDERDGSVLSMRTLPAPGEPDERLIVVSWSCWGTPIDRAINAQLHAAIVRLQRLLRAQAHA